MMKTIYKTLIITGVVTLLIICCFGIPFYNRILKPNVFVDPADSLLIHIPTGSELEDVRDLLYQKTIIKDSSTFMWMSIKKNYQNNVFPGRYWIVNRMNNNKLVNLLRSGANVPVMLTFNNVRTREQLAGRISSILETDSVSIMNILSDSSFLAEYGFSVQTIPAMFIPNSYEFFWNTSAKGFFRKMNHEYKNFWNQERISKAKEIGLSQIEISTLASIVEWETIKADEKPIVAGLYLNRIKKGIKLQADPTVIFANRDFSINRVLTKHLKIDSPYNTYKNKGLPPGPIKLPAISSIDAVLNPQNHNFLYMCAKEDFSGYHNFASNIIQHNRNARKYRKALNERNIYR